MDSQIAVVRTLIPDTDTVFGDNADEYLFSDDEISNFLIAGRNSVLRAAGYANLAIATSEVLISKKIRTQDLQTDGAATAEALIKKANALLKAADDEDSIQVDNYFFGIVDFHEPQRPELTEGFGSGRYGY